MYRIHGNNVNVYNCGIEIEVMVDDIYWLEVYTNAGFNDERQRRAANNIPYNFQGYAQYQDVVTNLNNMITAIVNQGERQTALNHWNRMNQHLDTANNVGIIVNPRK